MASLIELTQVKGGKAMSDKVTELDAKVTDLLAKLAIGEIGTGGLSDGGMNGGTFSDENTADNTKILDGGGF
jgi:hypothetical protein